MAKRKKKKATKEPTEPKRKPEPTVKQGHARILREALAVVHRSAPPQVQQYVTAQLTLYAKAIQPYCTHPETWTDPVSGTLICVDCGYRQESSKK